MKLTPFEQSAKQALYDHAYESQLICNGMGELMTSDELRANIARANTAFGLRPSILEQIARLIEQRLGVSMGLDQT